MKKPKRGQTKVFLERCKGNNVIYATVKLIQKRKEVVQAVKDIERDWEGSICFLEAGLHIGQFIALIKWQGKIEAFEPGPCPEGVKKSPHGATSTRAKSMKEGSPCQMQKKAYG